MNLLLFESSELTEDGELVLQGERAKHLREVLRVENGSSVRVGELNGRVGQAVVQQVSEREVSLGVRLDRPGPEHSKIDLILAVSRPQILKRVMEVSAAMGVHRIMLIGSGRVEKGYFTSPMLKPEGWRKHLLLGMAQGISTHLPKVSLEPRFTRFVNERLPAVVSEESVLVLAHPESERRLADVFISSGEELQQRVVLAIGPEGGWLPHEVDAFTDRGFIACGVGERILRVDAAVCALLANIQLARELNVRQAS